MPEKLELARRRMENANRVREMLAKIDNLPNIAPLPDPGPDLAELWRKNDALPDLRALEQPAPSDPPRKLPEDVQIRRDPSGRLRGFNQSDGTQFDVEIIRDSLGQARRLRFRQFRGK